MFNLSCVASVSVRFRNKERGTRVKDGAKNGASKRARRGGEERKETKALGGIKVVINLISSDIILVDHLTLLLMGSTGRHLEVIISLSSEMKLRP